MFRKKTIKQRVGREWPTWQYIPIVVLLVLSNFEELISLPPIYRRLASIAFLVLFGFRYLTSLWSAKFELLVGQSSKAVHMEAVARRSVWIQTSIHVAFVVAVSSFAQFRMLWFLIVVAWIFGWMLVYFFWTPRTFRVKVHKDKDDTFIVTGLQSKFLRALQRRLVEGPDIDDSVSR